jgi:hypothetical protein
MNYAKNYYQENNYVSVNSLIRPSKNPGLSLKSPYAAGTSKMQFPAMNSPLSQNPWMGLHGARAPVRAKQNAVFSRDSAELEADKIADEVLKISEADRLERTKNLSAKTPGDAKVAIDNQSKPSLMAKECVECNQALPRINNDSSQDIIPRVKEHISKCPGKPLSKNARDFFEPVFQRDFGNVNVHICDDSIRMNQDLNTQAFTFQNHVFFNKGKYNPDSREGKGLLAHELTHVVQNQGKTEDAIQTFRLPVPEFLGLPDIYVEPVPHTHPLEPCVLQSVSHIGVVVRKKGPQSTGKGKILFDLHTGFYKDNLTNRVCFVIFESKTRYCYKLCFPNWNDLKRAWEKIRDGIADTLKMLFEIVGIAVAAWLIYLIADAIATALVALLAALAVA